MSVAVVNSQAGHSIDLGVRREGQEYFYELKSMGNGLGGPKPIVTLGISSSTGDVRLISGAPSVVTDDLLAKRYAGELALVDLGIKISTAKAFLSKVAHETGLMAAVVPSSLIENGSEQPTRPSGLHIEEIGSGGGVRVFQAYIEGGRGVPKQIVAGLKVDGDDVTLKTIDPDTKRLVPNPKLSETHARALSSLNVAVVGENPTVAQAVLGQIAAGFIRANPGSFPGVQLGG